MTSGSSSLPPTYSCGDTEVSDSAISRSDDLRSLCFCSDLPKEHIHCVCEQCNGMPVSRMTEYRHRMDRRSALASKRVTDLDPSVYQVSVL